MSLTKEVTDALRQLNSLKSTGPKSKEGKQRSSMNALKHNLSGQHLILQETEVAAYVRMSTAMLQDLCPNSEPERQIAQKIIDTNFRLNRIAAIENNLFSFGIFENETQTDHDDRIEVMAAQTRAWVTQSTSFENLGRYEARLSRQLIKYQQEFERLQAERRRNQAFNKHRSKEEMEDRTFDPASFGDALKPLPPGPGPYRILSYLPPPKPPQAPPPAPPSEQTPMAA